MNKSGEKDSITLKRDVANMLYAFHYGHQRSITSKQLAERLNLRCATPVRTAIAELRCEGQPIASSNRQPEGYYIPASVEEANECLQHLHSRVRKICMVAAGMERGLRARYGDQLQFGFEYKEGNQIPI